MIDAVGIEKSFGARKLFGPLDLRLDAGERWALVGPNGSGKTTLLRILAGVESPDGGEIRGRKGLSVGYLPQEADVGEGTPLVAFVEDVAEEVRAAGEELRRIGAALAVDPCDRPLLERYGHLQARFEHLGGYRLRADARRILAGLGFAEEEFGRPVSSFSGGWRMRALLARILLRDPDVLLLDEPTNHLDIVSLEWIEEYIRASKAAFLIVSHDVAFLDRIVNGIYSLEPGGLTKAKGTYARYVEERAERLNAQEAARARQLRRRAEEERFIERFRAKNTKAKAVQSRIKRLEKEEVIEAPSDEVARPVFAFPQPARSGKEVAVLRGVTVGYGEKIVYENLDFILQRGEKVALIGPNGAGKSTLLKLMAGVVAPSRGTCTLGLNVTVSYFSQHQMELLQARNSVLDEILRLPGYRTEREARSLLGAFLFSGDDVEKKVEVLSGGEKSRLVLARMMIDPGNLLLLDEPTNHLDIAACAVLKDALSAFEGTLAVITHDRDLIDRVATRVVYVDKGECRSYPGNYADYLRLRVLGGNSDAAGGSADTAPAGIPKTSGTTAERAGGRGRDARRAEAQRREEERRRTGPLRAEVEKFEREIGAREGRLAEVEGLLADPEVYADPARAAELARERARLAGELGDLTTRWEEAAQALEDVETALRAEMTPP